MSPRIKLLLIIFVMVSPVFASYLTYYFWRPANSVNYGELLPTKPLPLAQLQNIGSENIEAVKGKWILLTVDSGTCDTTCKDKLYLIRQIRTAQGKHMDRIARALVVDDNSQPTPEVMKDYAGTVVLKGNSQLLSLLPTNGGLHDHVFLIDPLGNLVLRYPLNPNPKKMIKDLTRLLSVSNIG
ncbi:MAG: hypothetical protein V4568_03935 [Pseudomonadota bacterium]